MLVLPGTNVAARALDALMACCLAGKQNRIIRNFS
jgi:hypothetical protein